MKRFDFVVLAVVVCVAAALRVWAPWDAVFGSSRTNFLETDSWYHVRIVENQVRNFPRHLTVDPYAAPNAQYVAVAPLFDTLISTVVFVTQGANATTPYMERVAALAPAVIGVLAVVAIWALATSAFDRRAGLLAAACAAIFPGHFLDRTEIGFVDHHALEVLLAIAMMAALVWSFRTSRSALVAGALLGFYLLAWSSGAYFVAILSIWVVMMPVIGRIPDIVLGARSSAIAAGIALAIVVAFQDPNLFRYNTQVASLSLLLIVSLLMMMLAGRILIALGVVVAAAIVLVGGALMFAPDLARQIGIDLARFQPDATRMAVLEARPLFMYPGNWEWLQPWMFFGPGFYVGIIATMTLAIGLRRSQRLDHLLIVVFTVANYAATIGQNRFGYYLVPATALTIGWLGARILDWGRAGSIATRPGTSLRSQYALSIAAIVVVLAPGLYMSATKNTRSIGMQDYWADAMRWFRSSTPEPFGDPDFYLARYGPSVPQPAFTVMNWWDQGYWLVQMAHRVPVSNPTQTGAPTSAAFFTATDEASAMALLEQHRARYVMVDWELPFREAPSGSIAGRFQNLADWAGVPTSQFYRVCFTRRTEVDPWTAVWIFQEAYYQSMAYRLMVLGGGPASPVNNTFVIQIRDREDTTGRRFCEAGNAQRFATADEAKAAAAARGPEFHAVGLTPWQPAFPARAIDGLRLTKDFRSASQKDGEAPMVRVFEVTR